MILTRGKSLEAPLAELRKHNEEPTRATSSPAQDDIARIVKETITVLNGGKGHADEFAAYYLIKPPKKAEESVG